MEKMNFVWLGIVVILLSLWGGAYIIHIAGGTWIEMPTIITAVFGGFFGLCIMVAGVKVPPED